MHPSSLRITPPEHPMATKAATAPAVEPCVRYNPEQTLRNKATRDDRRKSIRAQNARSKSLK